MVVIIIYYNPYSLYLAQSFRGLLSDNNSAMFNVFVKVFGNIPTIYLMKVDKCIKI